MIYSRLCGKMKQLTFRSRFNIKINSENMKIIRILVKYCGFYNLKGSYL